MKTKLSHHQTPRHKQRAILIGDCILYLGLFFVVLCVAFAVFESCWDNAQRLRRATDDITGTLKAGERWRADVRAASAPLRLENSPDGPLLRIPQKSGEVDYRFSDNALWRKRGEADWAPVLAKIKSSRMDADTRKQVIAWRWEVELITRRKDTHVVPLFTFEAVPNP